MKRIVFVLVAVIGLAGVVIPRECSVHGQGLKEVRRDGRLGVR
jgi:hypothetical protein